MHKIFKFKQLMVLGLCACFFMTSLIAFQYKSTACAAEAGIYTYIQKYDKEELKKEIEAIYNKRSSAFVTGDLNSLKDLFDTSQKYGQWGLEHEVRRVKYLNSWAKQRKMKFTNVESTVRVKKVYPGSKVAKMALEETYKFDYIYPDDPVPFTNSFGVGIRHTVSLTKNNDKWIIYNDWYTDCFEDALASYSGEIRENLTSYISAFPTINIHALPAMMHGSMKKPYYNRAKAVEYADKYCGAAWGSGNDFKYNKNYMDFNGAGGDCTNYASQVLGDKEAGGLPSDGAWHCSGPKFSRCQGSMAWVNADGLKDYLVYSGKGSIIKRGTFLELTELSPTTNQAAVDKLLLGDLVCYEKKGNIDHFGVVTARDSHGYLLINSHTTDRYHVPWDLGWGDKKIRFFLIHING
ncbi:MAG: amidase domain-containing protein [Bacillota bacterium]|nr:amidase domain-containing protein [Bacillota bacterium]